MYAFNGERVNILIITDRLIQMALPLYDFFNNYEDINCSLIKSSNHFDPNISDIPDILISAGYLENDDNWSIVEKVRKVNAGVICILWGIVDACILDFTKEYKFNECFERSLPFEEFLKHIQVSKNENLCEHDFQETNMYSSISFLNENYDIIAYTGDIINMRKLGIYPVKISHEYWHGIKYTSRYYIKNDMIFLKRLCIKNHSVHLSKISNIAPVSEQYIQEGHVYNEINTPWLYTGKIILGKNDHRIINTSKPCLINEMFGWKKIIMLDIQNGKVIRYETFKSLLRYVHRWCICLPLLEHLKHYNKCQDLILTDACSYSYMYRYHTPQRIFERYMEYINAYTAHDF